MTTRCKKCNTWVDARGHPCPFDYALDDEEREELRKLKLERAERFDDEGI